MSVGGVALPLLTALPGNLDPSGHGAVRAGQPHVHGAERHAAHRSVQTGTLVLAAALEGLSALVHHASEHAGGALASWMEETTRGKSTFTHLHSGLFTADSHQTFSFFRQLTCAHSYASVDGRPEVTVQALVRVAHVLLCAQLPHLLGAHPAAAAAVQHQAHSWGTLGGRGRARALVAALLSCSLSAMRRHTNGPRLV